MSTLSKLEKYIPVLNHFIENVPDVPHNTVQTYKEYFYIRKPYTVLLFKNYEDAFEMNQISHAFGIVNYGKSSSITTCVNGLSTNNEMYQITPNEIFFSSLIMNRDIDKGEYFSLSIEHNLFLKYEELHLLYRIKEPGCTINIKNL